MAIGPPAPALLHWYVAGPRGGGFFALGVTSTGAPGMTFWVPASNAAQGRTQIPASSGFPCASLRCTQRCDRCLHSEFLRQLLPSPTWCRALAGGVGSRPSLAAS